MFGIDSASRAGHTTPREHGVPQRPGPDPANRAVRPRDAERILSMELLGQLRLLNETMSAFSAQQRGGISNGVLEVATFVFDASGQVVRPYSTQVGTIIVTNATGAVVTVQAGTSPSSSAPSSGRGVQLVPTGTWLCVPIGSHAFTLWGTAGASVSCQVFTGNQGLGANA